MLVIRKKQMTALREVKLQQFAEMLSTDIRKQHNRVFQYYTDKQLHTWLVKQLHYLDQHQIDSEEAVIKVIELLAQFGEKFELCKNPDWALDIIETPGNSADFKAALLEHHAEKQLENNLLYPVNI